MFIYCLLLLSYGMKVLQQSSVESVVYICVTHLQLLVSFLYSQAAFVSSSETSVLFPHLPGTIVLHILQSYVLCWRLFK